MSGFDGEPPPNGPSHGNLAWRIEGYRAQTELDRCSRRADEHLIEQALLLARSQHKTLNAMFREWLEQFTARSGGAQEFDSLMRRLEHVQAEALQSE